MSRTFDIGRWSEEFFNDLPKLANTIAGLVMKDIMGGIDTSKDVHNKPFKRLKAVTVKAKRRRGAAYPSRPLEDTGAMKQVYIKKYATKAKMKAIIIMPLKIGEVGVYHNLGGTTVKGKPPLREWFAIGSRVFEKAEKFVEQYVLSH